MSCAAALVAAAFAAPAAAAGYAGGGGGPAGGGGDGPIPHSHHGDGAVGPNGPSGLSYGPGGIASPANTGDPNSGVKPPPVSAQSGLAGREPTGDWRLRHQRHY
jgi:hypothetical protein